MAESRAEFKHSHAGPITCVKKLIIEGLEKGRSSGVKRKFEREVFMLFLCSLLCSSGLSVNKALNLESLETPSE